MRITHYTNSFLQIDELERTLLCDPWVGHAAQNAWVSHPIIEGGERILRRAAPSSVFISHLHLDHFDRALLLHLDDKHIPFYIRRYGDGRLCRFIRALGFHNVVECDPWTPVSLDDAFEITILPADLSNTAGLQSEVSYDLDSSLLLRSKRTAELFYNNVDTPMSIAGLTRVREFARARYQRQIDYACLAVGAASEFPQCFPTLDRAAEQQRIIEESLASLEQRLNALQPRVFFPAGGSYVISGKFHPLNAFIAQPKAGPLRELAQDRLKIPTYFLEGGRSLHHSASGYRLRDPHPHERSPSREETIQRTRDIPYPYSTDSAPDAGRPELGALFRSAESRYRSALRARNVAIGFRIEFHLYANLALDSAGRIDAGCRPEQRLHILPDPQEPTVQTLRCHLDTALFRKLLTKEYVWNNALSGSYILFERDPNLFLPVLPFSLNYLTT